MPICSQKTFPAVDTDGSENKLHYVCVLRRIMVKAIKCANNLRLLYGVGGYR